MSKFSKKIDQGLVPVGDLNEKLATRGQIICCTAGVGLVLFWAVLKLRLKVELTQEDVWIIAIGSALIALSSVSSFLIKIKDVATIQANNNEKHEP